MRRQSIPYTPGRSMTESSLCHLEFAFMVRSPMRNDSLQQFVKLHRQLTEEKSTLEARLRQINEALGGLEGAPASAGPSRPAPSRGRGGKRNMSPEARERIAAAQRARWAAKKKDPAKAPSATGAASGKPQRKMSPAARRAIAEAARRRWAAAKAAGRSRL